MVKTYEALMLIIILSLGIFYVSSLNFTDFAPTLPSQKEEPNDLSCNTWEDCYENFPEGPGCEGGFFECQGLIDGACVTVCPGFGRGDACSNFPRNIINDLPGTDSPDPTENEQCKNILNTFCGEQERACKDRCYPYINDVNRFASCIARCEENWGFYCERDARICCNEKYPPPNSVSE